MALPTDRPTAQQRAGILFDEIAHTASTIRHLATMLAGKGVTTLEDEGAVLVAVEKLAERAGMLADLGLSCGGDVETVGRLGRMGASTWQFQRWAAGA